MKNLIIVLAVVFAFSTTVQAKKIKFNDLMKGLEKMEKLQSADCDVRYKDWFPEKKQAWKMVCLSAYRAYCSNNYREANRQCNYLSVDNQENNCRVCGYFD